MKKSLITAGSILILLLFLLHCSAPNKADETNAVPSRPNVLMIVVDDLGWKDVGYMGGEFFETLNIDRLASEGMTFSRCYAGAANCAPSRACLISGKNTPRHGIYTVSSSERGKSAHRKIIPTPNLIVLDDHFFTLPELFKEAGYETATFGKWHLGEDPATQGFDVNFGGGPQGSPGKNGYFSPYNISNLEDGPAGEHLTDRLTTEAIQFIKNKQDQPFFLYLPYYSVHTPILAKDSLKNKYAVKTGNLKGVNTVYAAMVETMDHNVGRVIAALKEQNLTENTLVIFTSDNGGIRSIATQEPLRAGKGSYYEGGIRVPCAIRWPGVIDPGASSNAMIRNLDFFPTMLSILKISKPDLLLDGTDLLPLLQGGSIPQKPFYWHFPIYLQAYDKENDDGRDPLFRTRPGSVVIQGNWKLHEYFEDGGLELYNLEEDPGERRNLAEENPDMREEMLALLNTWRKNTNAPVPSTPNPDYAAPR